MRQIAIDQLCLLRPAKSRPFWLRRDSARCQSRPFIHRNLGRSIKFHGSKVDVGISRELLHGVDLRTVAACGFAHAGANCVTGVGQRPGGDRSKSCSARCRGLRNSSRDHYPAALSCLHRRRNSSESELRATGIFSAAMESPTPPKRFEHNPLRILYELLTPFLRAGLSNWGSGRLNKKCAGDAIRVVMAVLVWAR
jgi:hypothetical protein